MAYDEVYSTINEYIAELCRILYSYNINLFRGGEFSK